MTPEYIDQTNIIEAIEALLEGQESQDVEFKSAKGGFPHSFWETYSSFANTEGGVIIFGVRENKHIFSAQPLSSNQVDEYKKIFFRSQNDRHIVSMPLLSDKDVRTYPYDDGFILAFYIPRATRIQRPIYVGQDPLTGTFRRNHEGDYICAPNVPTQMYAERTTGVSRAESRILTGFTWDDIDPVSFRQYRTLFANLTPSHPWAVLDDIELLTKLGGYRKDRVTGAEGFTMAGLLMFGKYDSITDPECAPDFMVDYREVPSDTSSLRWTDRIYSDGTWEANLFQFYRTVLPRLHAFLPKPFVLKGDERQDETSAHVALREALFNQLVHAAYGASCRLVIVKSPNGIRLSNPGTMLVSISQYYEGGVSECRNPSLQKMFSLIGRSDKAGSGVDKILQGWKEANWRRPYIEEKSKPDMVDLFLPMEALISESALAILKNFYGTDIVNIDHNSLSILAFAAENKDVSHPELRNVLELHPADISKLLHTLCVRGYLISFGVGRGCRYRLNEDFAERHLDDASSNNASSKAFNCNTTDYAKSKADDASSDDASSDDASSDDASSDDASSDDASSDDASSNEMEMLRNFCFTWRKISEISMNIGRSNSHTRNRLIRNLIRKGLIEMEYPDTPTHPAQRYRWKN